MKRKINVNEINLSIAAVIPFSNEKYDGIQIEWDADIGFGMYTLYRGKGSGKWCADSEHMDSSDDKDFLKKLLSLFVDEVQIES